MTDGDVARKDLSALRHQGRQLIQLVIIGPRRIGLHPVARLQNEGPWLRLAPQSRGEALAVHGRNLAGMRDEGDDGAPDHRTHFGRAAEAPGLTASACRPRPVASPWPVIVAMS